MKISDLLRALADTVEAEEQSIDEPGALDAIADYQPDETVAQVPTDVFVSPLQLEIELLKKAGNVDNMYDQCEEEMDIHSYPSQMDQIRKNAGLGSNNCNM